MGDEQRRPSYVSGKGDALPERYRALFETTTDGIMIVDDEGRYVEVNDSLCRMLRATRERLVGAHFAEFIPPDQLDEAVRAFAALKAGGPIPAMEFPLRAADGTIVELEWSSRADFVPGLHFCIARDISARKRAEGELRLSEARLARAQRISQVGVWEVDFGTGEVFWSEEMYRLFGVERGRYTPSAEGFLDAVPEEDRPLIREAAERAIRGRSAYEITHRILLPDGSVRFVRESAEVVFDGESPRFLGTMQDVTERRQVESELARLNAGLRQRVAELQALMEILPVGVAIAHDPECRFMSTNPNLASLLRLQEYENISKSGPEPDRLPYTILRDGKEVDPSTLPMQLAAARGEKVARQECEVRLADGTLVRLLIGAVPLFDEEGRVKGSIGVHTDVTALKQAKEELQRSEERYRRFIEQSSEGIYRFEAEPPIPLDRPEEELVEAFYRSAYLAECNDALARMYGFSSAAELVGARLDDFLPRSDPHNVEYLRSFIRSGYRLSDAESHEVDREGDPKYFLNNLVGILEGGQLVRAWGTQRDVTDRKRAEEELRASQERFAHFMQHLPGLAWIKDVEGRYIFANDAATKAFRTPREELYGRTDGDIFPRDTALAFKQNDAKALRSGGVQAIETLVQEDGVHHSIVSKFPIPGSDDEGVLIGGVAIDISERLRAEEALRESEERFRRISESGILSIAFFTEDGAIKDANDAFLALIGFSREELEAGMVRWDRLTPPEWMERTRRGLDEFRATGRITPYEKEYFRKDGSRFWGLFGGARLEGRAEGVSFVLDITDRKLAETALREADRRKDEFLAMLAHELRNPLSAIANAMQLLHQPGCDAGQIDWSKEVIARQVKHLTGLIDDLLDVSRITRGKVVLKTQPVEATVAVSNAIESVRPLIGARGHLLEVSLGANLRLEADPTRLEQVLVNLLSNAAKYTPDGGTIRIEARREGDSIVFTVRDTGIGIPPERLPAMFELFAQGDRTLARSEGGLGIGLTLVKSLAELHGGSVVARSEGPGEGSEFTVRMPVGEASAREVRREITAPPSAGTASRILVVDDSIDSARGLARLLKLLGHHVRVEHGGPEAIEAALAERPDFILLDIGLPGMDGYQVATRLRREDSLRGVVIIAISGYGQEEDRRRSREVGIDHHLVKPIDHAALTALLARAGEY